MTLSHERTATLLAKQLKESIQRNSNITHENHILREFVKEIANWDSGPSFADKNVIAAFIEFQERAKQITKK